MTIFSKLFKYGVPKPVSDTEWQTRRENRIRRIVGRVSSGSVPLQQGAFTTAADVAEMRKKTEK
ncbi:MAG: hypothetical protein LBT89_10235 [Planctomycetaceae bacterium]|nr:hypothetical protein [Planctomycetaceae bacterium]